MGKCYIDKFLLNELKRYICEFNEIPTSNKINSLKDYPSPMAYIKHFKSWTNALKLIGINDKNTIKSEYKKEKYSDYVDLFIKLSNEIGRPLKHRELVGKTKITNELPDGRWFLKYCPDKNVTNYNQFIEYCGFKPRYNISKEKVIEAIYNMQNKLDRPLNKYDFSDPSEDEVGISIIQHYWGSMNNMKKELGLEIVREYMVERHKEIDELKEDIIKLCKYIKETENRDIITIDDIEDCEWCLSYQSYNKYIKQELNMTICDYIKSLGYKTNIPGMGMVYEFEDGEKTYSKWEYIISKYLKDNNIIYNRDVKYNTFIDDYNNQMNCDYIIENNGLTWYVEVAGILDYTKMKKENNIRRKYKKDLDFKENMLKNNNLNYRIIYPHEIKNNPLDDIFNFLVA